MDENLRMDAHVRLWLKGGTRSVNGFPHMVVGRYLLGKELGERGVGRRSRCDPERLGDADKLLAALDDLEGRDAPPTPVGLLGILGLGFRVGGLGGLPSWESHRGAD